MTEHSLQLLHKNLYIVTVLSVFQAKLTRRYAEANEMLKLNPIKCEKIWGYELWIASTHKAACQKEFFEHLAEEYPLLVKIIHSDDFLSVQVHPDDKTALLLEGDGSRGKTECWYILDAEPDSEIIYGFNNHYTHEEIERAITEGRLEALLRRQKVSKGDFIFIPAGTVHAIGGGLTLLEVQQSCDITYRLYDWNRGRELHIEKSLKSIAQTVQKQITPLESRFECPYFSLEKKTLNGGWSFLVSGESKTKSCTLLFIETGKGIIKCGEERQKVAEHEIFALFSGEKITVEGNISVIKIDFVSH